MKAICVLDNNHGSIFFEEDSKTKITTIYGAVQKLTTGKHGIHIHELGNISNGCETLGGHYNPFNMDHGGPFSKVRHVGDLGNIKANKSGVAKFRIQDKLIRLTGKYSVIGRSA